MIFEKPFWKYVGDTMANFEEAYAPVKQWEGGWCDVAGDAGGETYAGIARNFFPDWTGWTIVDDAKKNASFAAGARKFSTHLAQVEGLSSMVEEWYRVEWWDAMGIANFPQEVANEIFEQAINLGRAGSGRYIQRLCNAFNWHRTGAGEERYFDDLVEDGALGPKSLQAIAMLLQDRVSAKVFVHSMNGLQVAHYIGLGAKNFHHRKFVNGWLTRT